MSKVFKILSLVKKWHGWSTSFYSSSKKEDWPRLKLDQKNDIESYIYQPWLLELYLHSCGQMSRKKVCWECNICPFWHPQGHVTKSFTPNFLEGLNLLLDVFYMLLYVHPSHDADKDNCTSCSTHSYSKLMKYFFQ